MIRFSADWMPSLNLLLASGPNATDPTEETTATRSPQQASPAISIQRFTVPGPASVNTWWLEAPQGLIVVDFQRDTASASQAIEAIKALGRPVHTLLLTHSHPDHIGGIELFKEAFPNAPLLASAATADEIRSDSRGYQAMTREAMGELAPASFPLPDRVLTPGQLDLAGLEFTVREFGAGESVSATVYRIDATGQAIVGDVVSNGMTDFLLEGRTGLWLEQLDKLSALCSDDDLLYPGHGDFDQAKRLIADQDEYLRFFRDRVQEQIAKGGWEGDGLKSGSVSAVVDAVEAAYPGRPPVAAIPGLQELNVQAVATELNQP